MVEPVRGQRRFLIDESAVEVRLAELAGSRLVRLKLFPKIVPGIHRPQVGDFYAARIVKAARGMNAAFVALGEGGEALLRLPRPLAEGMQLLVRVSQAGHGQKLPVVLRVSGGDGELENELSKRLPPRRVRAAPGALETALLAARPGEPILADGEDVLRAARLMGENAAAFEAVRIGLFEREGVEAQIEAALESCVSLPGGGRLVIEETQAVTAIDVDVAGAPRAGDVNLAAAAEIAYQIALRRLAGAFIVDFAQIGRTAELTPLKAELQAAAAKIDLDLKIGVSGRTGLLELQRARTDAPLSSVMAAARMTHSAVPFAWSDEAEAARLARALRIASTRIPGALSARVKESFAEFLARGGAPAWQAIVAASAVPLHLKPDRGLIGESFVVERNEKGAA